MAVRGDTVYFRLIVGGVPVETESGAATQRRDTAIVLCMHRAGASGAMQLGDDLGLLLLGVRLAAEALMTSAPVGWPGATLQPPTDPVGR